MPINREKPHIYILPEDSADNDIANGFLHNTSLSAGCIRVLHPAGGWRKLVSEFDSIHAREMERYRERYMILVLDCDQKSDRLEKIKEEIPEHLKDRVFVLGILSNPEKLRQATSLTFEAIGKTLAEECRCGVTEPTALWNHDLLQHNAEERERMAAALKPILFPQG